MLKKIILNLISLYNLMQINNIQFYYFIEWHEALILLICHVFVFNIFTHVRKELMQH